MIGKWSMVEPVDESSDSGRIVEEQPGRMPCNPGLREQWGRVEFCDGHVGTRCTPGVRHFVGVRGRGDVVADVLGDEYGCGRSASAQVEAVEDSLDRGIGLEFVHDRVTADRQRAGGLKAWSTAVPLHSVAVRCRKSMPAGLSIDVTVVVNSG